MPNPDPSPKTRFKTKRKEPLTESLSLRIPASMKVKLEEQDDWRELVRNAITKELESS